MKKFLVDWRNSNYLRKMFDQIQLEDSLEEKKSKLRTGWSFSQKTSSKNSRIRKWI